MARQLPQPGLRVSLRRIRVDGEHGDLIGFVLSASAAGISLRDRRGMVHELTWPEVLAWRAVGVARGRDPLRTPLADLDALASEAGVGGRTFVARLCDLLDARMPPPAAQPGGKPPQPAVRSGEWVTTLGDDELIALAWWATHQDARSLQVRTADPAVADRLLAAGFTERTV